MAASISPISGEDRINGEQEFRIRRATLADLDSIARIWREGIESGLGVAPPTLESTIPFFSDRLESEKEPYG
jgi:hypothetical protein